MQGDTRTYLIKLLQFGLLTAALFVGGSAQAGTGRQTTTFLVEADELLAQMNRL